MKVILTSDVKNLGVQGDIVEVKPGYARNFLLPRNLAMPATEGNMKVLAERRKQQEIIDAKNRKAAEELAKKLKKVSITVSVLAGEDEKLFGSVTSREIARLLSEQGIEVDRKQIVLDEPIRTLGVFSVPIKLHRDVETAVRVWVVKEQSA